MDGRARPRGDAEGLRGDELRPLEGRDPPRPQAGQRDGRSLRRGLRHGLGARARPGWGRDQGHPHRSEPGVDGPALGAAGAGAGAARLTARDDGGRRGGHAGLHGPRAGGRAPGVDGAALRRLFGGRDAVPPPVGDDALRPARLRDQQLRDLGPGSKGPAQAPGRARSRPRAGAGRHLREGDGPRARGALRRHVPSSPRISPTTSRGAWSTPTRRGRWPSYASGWCATACSPLRWWPPSWRSSRSSGCPFP